MKGEDMPAYSYTDVMRKILQKRPDEVFVIPDGSALLMLAGPENNDVIFITAPSEGNFNDMTDQEVNEAIVTAFKK